MKISYTEITGLIIIEPKIFVDNRGYFLETFQKDRYTDCNIPHFVQENVSHSKKGVLRGLHYQLHQAQGKLVWVSYGNVWDVAVDIRLYSRTFGQWFGIELNAQSHKQMYIPPGFAHGFCVLSDEAIFHYQCTDYYHPRGDYGLLWNDKNLNIHWPIKDPILSQKDLQHPTLDEVPHERLFA